MPHLLTLVTILALLLWLFNDTSIPPSTLQVNTMLDVNELMGSYGCRAVLWMTHPRVFGRPSDVMQPALILFMKI